MSFRDGLDAFNESLTLVRRRRIRSFVWAPATVSLVVIVTCTVLTIGQLDAAITRFLAWLPDSESRHCIMWVTGVLIQ